MGGGRWGLLFIKLKLCLLGAQRERNMAPYVGYPLHSRPSPEPLASPAAHCFYSLVPRTCYSEPCLSAGNDQDRGLGGYQWMKREGAQKGGGLTVVLIVEKERKRKRRKKKNNSPFQLFWHPVLFLQSAEPDAFQE